MMKQEYEEYTAEDHLVWKTLYLRQLPGIRQYACKAVMEGMELCGFEADQIPDFAQINQRLGATAGWQIYVVPGLIDKKPFFTLLHEKKFPATTWLRKMSELDYLEEPDMFHDVFGHIPLLTNKDFCNFLQLLSGIALEHIDDEPVIEMPGRLYWFTVEFGLIRENGKEKAYGAGLLSSFGETAYSIDSPEPRKIPFTIHEAMNTIYYIDHFQDKYFVINELRDLFDSIPMIGKELELVNIQ